MKSIRDVIAAPDFEEGAVDILAKCRKGNYKGKMRVFKTKPFSTFQLDVRIVDGAAFVQKPADYSNKLTREQIKVVSEKNPTEEQIIKMMAAEDVVWRVPSNAVVIGDGRFNDGKLEAFWTYGVGTGIKRNLAAKIAVDNANDWRMLGQFKMPTDPRALGAVAASDGFFPLSDSLEELVYGGVEAVLSGAGAMREKEVIEKADWLEVPLVLSSKRIFSH